MLSTLELIMDTTKDDNCYKLGSYKLHNFTKGGTDIVDQRMRFHTIKTKSIKWTLVMFAHMHDTARVNSSTIFALSQGKDPIKEKSSEYTYNLWWDQSNPPLRCGTKSSWLQKSSKKLLLCWIVLYHSQSCTKMMDLLLVLREKGVLCAKRQLLEKGTLKKKDSIPYVKTLCQSCGNATCPEHMLQKCTVLRLRFHVLRLLLQAWLKKLSCFWNFFAGTAISNVFFHRFGLNQSLGK